MSPSQNGPFCKGEASFIGVCGWAVGLAYPLSAYLLHSAFLSSVTLSIFLEACALDHSSRSSRLPLASRLWRVSQRQYPQQAKCVWHIQVVFAISITFGGTYGVVQLIDLACQTGQISSTFSCADSGNSSWTARCIVVLWRLAIAEEVIFPSMYSVST